MLLRGEHPIGGIGGGLYRGVWVAYWLRQVVLASDDASDYPASAMSELGAYPALSPLARSSSSMRALRRPISSACSTIIFIRYSCWDVFSCVFSWLFAGNFIPLSLSVGRSSEGVPPDEHIVLSISPSPYISQSRFICSQNENTRGKSIEFRDFQLETVAFETPSFTANSLSLFTFKTNLSLESIFSDKKVLVLCIFCSINFEVYKMFTNFAASSIMNVRQRYEKLAR